MQTLVCISNKHAHPEITPGYVLELRHTLDYDKSFWVEVTNEPIQAGDTVVAIICETGTPEVKPGSIYKIERIYNTGVRAPRVKLEGAAYCVYAYRFRKLKEQPRDLQGHPEGYESLAEKACKTKVDYRELEAMHAAMTKDARIRELEEKIARLNNANNAKEQMLRHVEDKYVAASKVSADFASDAEENRLRAERAEKELVRERHAAMSRVNELGQALKAVEESNDFHKRTINNQSEQLQAVYKRIAEMPALLRTHLLTGDSPEGLHMVSSDCGDMVTFYKSPRTFAGQPLPPYKP
jgi:DNA repair exonuclease SbcCD ATPase subunit